MDEERRPCLLDPLFNKRFLALFVALFATLYCCLSFRTSPRMAPAVIREIPDDKDDYSAGYREGYAAFLNQIGGGPTDPSVPERAEKRYSSSEHGYEGDQKIKGYVDGYHRASEIQNCPRGFYER